jgi:hypothetical protein
MVVLDARERVHPSYDGDNKYARNEISRGSRDVPKCNLGTRGDSRFLSLRRASATWATSSPGHPAKR